MADSDSAHLSANPRGYARYDSEDNSFASDGSENDIDSDIGEDDRGAAKETRRAFDDIIKKLCNESITLDTPEDIEDFMRQYRRFLFRRSPLRRQTLLHQVAEVDVQSLEKLVPLVVLLVKEYPELLKAKDEDGKTPLLVALAAKRSQLVRAMCDTYDKIDTVLQIPKGEKGHGTNCLHQAASIKISNEEDHSLVLYLISKSSEATLLAPNEAGLTPLHLAVDCKRCSVAQLAIVTALVEKCDKALDKKIEGGELDRLSPYLYHEFTAQQLRKKQLEKKRKAAEKANAKSAVGPGSRDGQGKAASLDKPISQANLPEAPRDQYPRDTRETDAPVGKFGAAKPEQPTLKTIMNQSRPIRRNTGSKTPIAAEPVKKKEDKTKELQYKYVEGSEVGIKDYLKLYYLRERDHDAAVEFLYGSQQDRQIYFDLFGCGPTLSESRIIRGWNHLDFEDVLQYVAIPQVRVEPDLPVKEMSLLSRNDGVGRCDFTILFNWLKKERLNGARKERRVKKILKVIVDDLQEPSHSDEAIEACLKDLDVEVWDWRRTDICSQVIKEASPNVRVVHLYWSGNNAVLQGWSVGLKDLPCLKQVVLHGQQGLESRARREQYVTDFKNRLKGHVEVEDAEVRSPIIDGGNGAAHATRGAYKRHQWVATMDDFADFLVSAERNLRPRGSIKPEVTVALIDDGVDINDEMIESRIIGGRSFCHREENLSQPYYVSGGGHGTAMAGLICRICPNVRLYVLKLDEYVIESGKRQITAKSAAKAIQAAVDKKVDIISMSWTIEKPDTGDKAKEDEITELESAIQLAAKKNILMFCAATDGGPVRDTTYPAASGTKWIFKIGAAEASGTAMKWLGSQDIVDFIMPGHQVVMERQNDPNVKRFTALTGSSVATALAAGLAAVILYCAQITVLLKEPGRRALDTPTYKALKTHEKMVAAFKRIGTTEGSNHKFIQVWELFGKEVDKTRKDLNYQAKDTWIVLVRRLGDSFLQLCES